MSLGEHIASLRRANGFSQGELARRMIERGFSSYSQVQVSRTEKNLREPRISEAAALADVLSTNLNHLAGREALASDAYNLGRLAGINAARNALEELT